MRKFAPYLLLITLVGCVEEPTPKDSEKAAAEVAAEDDAEALKAEQKSIEEAADAAAKLVEEDAREEIERVEADQAE
ncbi:MAG: hypothetical protein IPG54_01270 [Sphingomonadales bacterium]|jgi:hypothetical protein|nr:hypothetical protein [Sphingomonadales bacterium]MBK9003668.1 hypothetical protein [Sphingomonadales bacterium]MBK9268842.1 hypothetical protein [Sphingomonadales bacterium]